MVMTEACAVSLSGCSLVELVIVSGCIPGVAVVWDVLPFRGSKGVILGLVIEVGGVGCVAADSVKPVIEHHVILGCDFARVEIQH